MSGPLDGKVCVVTGALGLLGREMCRALAGAGGALVVTDVDERACQDRAAALPGAIGVGADIADPGAVARLRDAVLARHRRIDVLINNAAIDDRFAPGDEAAARDSMFEHYSLERWRRSLEVNVTGTFLCCQILGTPMAERGTGAIVNIASTYGVVAPDQALYRRPDGTQPFYKGPAYPTGKAAVLGLTRYLAAYWGRSGVRVNALSPGGVAGGQDPEFVRKFNERVPLGHMCAPEDLEGPLLFLASRASSYVTGIDLRVDGGFTSW